MNATNTNPETKMTASKPTAAKIRCIFGGSIDGATEATRVARCSCGFSVEATPRYDRRDAGQIIPGWTVRIPVHYEGRRK